MELNLKPVTPALTSGSHHLTVNTGGQLQGAGGRGQGGHDRKRSPGMANMRAVNRIDQVYILPVCFGK